VVFFAAFFAVFFFAAMVTSLSLGPGVVRTVVSRHGMCQLQSHIIYT
jgi:hypothetical protein